MPRELSLRALGSVWLKEWKSGEMENLFVVTLDRPNRPNCNLRDQINSAPIIGKLICILVYILTSITFTMAK